MTSFFVENWHSYCQELNPCPVPSTLLRIRVVLDRTEGLDKVYEQLQYMAIYLRGIHKLR